ncbi:MAG: response regulator transcription factor [Chloroflexota bacterium]|nr:response regulator transcription factor [Chloroflexota bacterium]
MTKIQVLVADDHTIVREGVRILLEAQSDIQVVGEAADGQEALERVRELQPDIVLIDIAMPNLNGLEATRAIKRDYPHVQVIVLTMYESDEYFFQVLNAGASGYVLKKAASSDLLAAIRAVHSGDVFLYPSVARRLVSDYLARVKSGEEQSSYDGLTPREHEVLKLIAEGHTNQAIADKLVISPSTVQTHRTRIMQRLNLHSRAELIQYAMRKGLLDRA